MNAQCSVDCSNADAGLHPVVFIVNSDESVRRWIEAAVVSTGVRALSFATAAELPVTFEPHVVACAILDVALADASGFELQDHLARAGASIMFATRECSTSVCVKAIKAGAIDFVTLPCESTQLVQAIHATVHHALSSSIQRAQLSELRSRYELLSMREKQVFALVSSGLLNKQVAQRLDIAEITVQVHRGRVMRKMSASTFAALVRMADALRPWPTGGLREMFG